MSVPRVQRSSTNPNNLPPVFLKLFGNNLERILHYLFFTGAFAIPISVAVLVAILKRGNTSTFPPSDPHVGWVKGPENRGTFNIIWVCISTIFTCVYVSVHVDIPVKSPSPNDSQWRIFKLWLRSTLRKAYWVFFNIFAPELMVLVALCEQESAKSGVEFMKHCGQAGWKMHHAFFADVGGFKLPGLNGKVFNTHQQKGATNIGTCI